jgi:5'(3')-deoxyribonucleotidase
MRVLLDVDGVLAALVEDLCQHLTDLGYHRVPEDIVRYEMRCVVTKPEADAIDTKMKEVGFCVGLPWYDGAMEFVEALREMSDVVVVTKPHKASPTWAHERELWLEPYIDRVVHTAHKEVVVGDVLIEDSFQNACKWLEHHPGKFAILIDRPWNRDAGLHVGVRRAYDYGDVLRLVEACGHQEEPTSPQLEPATR